MGKKLSAYNLHMKRELKGKMKGKTKAQRKAIFKAAARAWKSKGKSKPRSKPKSGGSSRSSSTTRRSNRTMGKNSFSMNKIYSIANKVAFAAPFVALALGTATPEYKVQRGIAYISGYDMRTNTWSFEDLKKGWLPYVATKTMTSIIPKISSFIRGLL